MLYIGSPVLYEPTQSLKLVRVSARSLTLQDDDIVMTWVWNTCIGVVYIIISSFLVVVRHYCDVPYIQLVSKTIYSRLDGSCCCCYKQTFGEDGRSSKLAFLVFWTLPLIGLLLFDKCHPNHTTQE